jgi:hypothetical protein
MVIAMDLVVTVTKTLCSIRKRAPVEGLEPFFITLAE